MVDRRHAVGGEELGEQPHHHLAVLEHVGDARGNPQIVLEDAKLAGVVAHDVDAGDVGVDTSGNVHALHLRAVLGVAEHLLRGDDARLQNLLLMVDVVDEGVQGPDTLLETALQANPLLQWQHPGNDVERDQALGPLLLAIDGEGDADPMEQRVGLRTLLRQAVGRLLFEPMAVAQVVRPRLAVAQVHFVVRFIAQKIPLIPRFERFA